MLTPSDLKNPSRQSGYNRVSFSQGTFQAAKRLASGVGPGTFWHGPRRKTAGECAQDFCDAVNNGTLVTPMRANKPAGHKRPQQPKRRVPSDIQAARGMIRDWEAQQKAGVQGYVYCIGEIKPGGGISAVKIGYSVNPAKRVPELQTGNPDLLRLLCMKKGTEAEERRLHRKYRSRNILQEWFSPTKEMLLEFDLDPDGKPYPAAQSGGATNKEVSST